MLYSDSVSPIIRRAPRWRELWLVACRLGEIGGSSGDPVLVKESGRMSVRVSVLDAEHPAVRDQVDSGLDGRRPNGVDCCLHARRDANRPLGPVLWFGREMMSSRI